MSVFFLDIENIYKTAFTILNISNVVNVLNTDSEKEIELTMQEANQISDNTSKNIVVHGALYKRLLIAKAGLILTGMPATFENVIIDNVNSANDFAVLVTSLMRSHPETKPWILELSKDISPEFYKRVEKVARVIGVKKE